MYHVQSYYDSEALIKDILEDAGNTHYANIYIVDNVGDMHKFSEIDTKTGGHKVLEIQVDLPEGRVIIVYDKGGYRRLTPAEVALYGPSKNS